jgi:hypothetical protein
MDVVFLDQDPDVSIAENSPFKKAAILTASRQPMLLINYPGILTQSKLNK